MELDTTHVAIITFTATALALTTLAAYVATRVWRIGGKR